MALLGVTLVTFLVIFRGGQWNYIFHISHWCWWTWLHTGRGSIVEACRADQWSRAGRTDIVHLCTTLSLGQWRMAGHWTKIVVIQFYQDIVFPPIASFRYRDCCYFCSYYFIVLGIKAPFSCFSKVQGFREWVTYYVYSMGQLICVVTLQVVIMTTGRDARRQ